MKRKRPGLSMLWELIIAGIVLTSVVIAILTGYLIRQERQLLLDQAKLRATTVSSFVSLILNQASRVEENLVGDVRSKNSRITLPLRFLSREVLQNVIELAQFHQDIKIVKIIDHNFSVVASYPYGMTGQTDERDFFRQSLSGQQLPRTRFAEIRGEKIIEITVPLVVYGSIAGTMYMGFSTQYLNEKIDSIIRSAVILALIFMVGQSVVISVFARIYTGPILELAGLARRISEGERVSIPVTKRNEIGYLQHSFQGAIDNQNRAIDTLNRTNVAYSRFIPREFLQFLNRETIIDVQLGDQIKKEMTILFADIRSFTTLSESMTPVENFNFLNDYLNKMGPVIRRHRGFIDKYIGDAIMALFPGRADDAVKASVDMIRILNRHNAKREKKGLLPIKIGIGIHTGILMLGTIGESERMETTVIADAVNLSSRLEGLTKKYGIPIAISGESLERLSNPRLFRTRFIDKVQVKGKQQAVDVYEVYDGLSGRDLDLRERLQPHYDKGISFYYRRRFDRSRDQFRKALSVDENDLASRIYYERSLSFLKRPPGKEWTGVEVLDSK